MKKRGFTLIATVFIVVAVTLFAVTITTLVSSGSHISVKNYESLNAFYIANAGFQYYLRQLKVDDDWSSPPAQATGQFSDGVFSIATTGESANFITVTVTAYYTVEGTTYQRMLQANIVKSGGWSFEDEYVMYWGGGGIGGGGDATQIDNNVTITGDLFADNDIDVGSNVTINGDTQSTGDVSGDTGGVSGTIETHVPTPETAPFIDTTYYDDQLAIAATYPSGNQSWNGNRTLSGLYYVNGDAAFGNNANISITGSATIVATGTFVVNNNVVIGDNFSVIADGLITIDNNVIIGKNNIWYSSTGFDVGNNAEAGDEISAGEGTSFITSGDIDIGNNIDFNGLLFCEGTLILGNNTDFDGNIIAGFVDSIGENSDINLSPELVDQTLIPGLESGSGTAEATDIETWDEIY
ncbi:MAG: hypothetical protein U9R38_00035 [Candidatus Margulisiibacteriota bacterium]|nr:hypothetical protein [Candidatus Margulisiibacteriota bacterium]